ncbi:hypothetical protein [Nocardioides ultimimeridianus]
MSDPLEQLDRFRSEVEGAPMLTAAEIRRRGDRMRRRGNALKTGVAALAVAAVVVPLSLNAGDHDSHVAKDTNPTPTAPALSTANLVTTSDVSFMKGLSWVQNYDEPVSTQQRSTACEGAPYPTLGGFSAGFERDWNAHSDETGEPSDTYLDEVVTQYGSPAQASAAAATIKGWYDHCSPSGSTSYTPGTWKDVPTGTTGTAEQMTAHYGPADAYPGSQFDVSGRTDLTWYVDVSIIVDGDRVGVLTQNALLRDYDTTAITTTDEEVPVAAQRLVSGTPAAAPTDAASPPAAPATSGGTVSYPTTTIPADFPIDSGWTDDQPEGPDSRIAPSRTRKIPELSACGTTLPWPAYVDRLSAGFHNPEDSRDATLMTYVDADAAAAATKAIADLYRACPSEPSQPPGYVLHTDVTRTTTSGDSWLAAAYYTYNGHPAIAISDVEVIRVGLGVLILSHNNEGDKNSIPMDTRSMEREASDSIAAMCAFTEAGC